MLLSSLVPSDAFKHITFTWAHCEVLSLDFSSAVALGIVSLNEFGSVKNPWSLTQKICFPFRKIRKSSSKTGAKVARWGPLFSSARGVPNDDQHHHHRGRHLCGQQVNGPRYIVGSDDWCYFVVLSIKQLILLLTNLNIAKSPQIKLQMIV